jgi:Na+-driven multidrug efflux pump
MSVNLIQQNPQQVASLQTQKATPSYEEKMSWYMRWFALIVLSTGYIASLITGILGFTVTRDPHFLIFVSPTLFTPAIFYLVPMDQKRFELKKLTIQIKAQQQAQKQRKQQRNGQ